MNLRSIIAAIGEISNPKRRGDVLSAAEGKLHLLGKKLNQMEYEYKQLDELVQFLKRQQ